MLPTFTYECDLCQTRWDEQRDRNDCDLEVSMRSCPECGDPLGQRVFSPPTSAAVLKGKGWARKDNLDWSKLH